MLEMTGTRTSSWTLKENLVALSAVLCADIPQAIEKPVM